MPTKMTRQLCTCLPGTPVVPERDGYPALSRPRRSGIRSLETHPPPPPPAAKKSTEDVCALKPCVVWTAAVTHLRLRGEPARGAVPSSSCSSANFYGHDSPRDRAGNRRHRVRLAVGRRSHIDTIRRAWNEPRRSSRARVSSPSVPRRVRLKTLGRGGLNPVGSRTQHAGKHPRG